MWQKWPKILIFDKNKDFLLKWVFLKKGQKIDIYVYNGRRDQHETKQQLKIGLS